ncbi:MAG TPA: alkaline phosphatase D family protein [Rhodothermales bacterium]|nr:alkaline phosphatase D family protein [Rhodothermales bacterium]
MPRPLRFVLLFLVLIPAAAAQRQPVPRVVTTRAATEPATLRSGPMLGYVLHREVVIWAQATGAARVQVRYWNEDTPSRRTLTPAVQATAETGYTAHVTIFGLEPGEAYGYELLLNGRTVPRSYPTRFQTQPLWQWRTDPPAFTFMLGSCNYVNEPVYDRPGTPYGAGHEIFTHMAAMRPNMMLWMGDNTYLREVDWWSEAGMNHRYAHTRALPEMQPLLASASNIATWDDHDYGPNDADGSWVLKGLALDMFKRYWANVSYGLPGVPGVFGHYQFQDAEFFLLDDRYHRSSNDSPADDKTYWGDAQLDWLLEALQTSQAPFKFIVNGGQILPPEPGGENLITYPRSYRRLLDELARRRISGVVFLSGDVHKTMLLRQPREDAPPLYEFTVSPLTAGPDTRPNLQPSRLAVEGTLVQRRNFGTVSLSGPRTARVATLRVYGTDGGLIWERQIAASELQYR